MRMLTRATHVRRLVGRPPANARPLIGARRIAIALAGVIVAGATAPVFTDVTTGGVYRPVNYFSFVPPAASMRYIDPGFGVTIKRISDATITLNAADTGMLPFVVNEYATVSPFNSDGSRLLLQHHSYFALYAGDGTYLGDLPFQIGASSEPRWSPTDPNLLFYLSGNELHRYDTATGEMALVRRFEEYNQISGTGESDLSVDGDHLVLVGDRREVFVYQISIDTKGPVLNTGELGAIDSVYITPENHVLVGWYAIGPGRHQGVELYDRDMNFLRQVSRFLGHMDVTRDVSGAEVLLLMNAADPSPAANCQNSVVKIQLADASVTCLLTLDWILAAHISAPDVGGRVIISTYAPGDPNPATTWPQFTGEILEVALDGSDVRRLAHHRSRPYNAYWWTPRASVSRDGRKVVYSSNYGLPGIFGYSNDYGDAYLIDRAVAAGSIAGSQDPVATRVEESDARVTSICPADASWYFNGLPSHSNSGAMLATNVGCLATFSFFGTAASWIGYRDEWAGIARIYVDGVYHGEVDTYISPARSQARLYTVEGLALGQHVVTIEVTGEQSPASGGAWVWVDAFDAVSRVEEDHPTTSFSCPTDVVWYTNALARHSGGTAALAVNEGCHVAFTFDGTAVSWIGYRDAWAGIARVSIDDLVRAEIDTYAPQDQGQARLYTLTGLESGRHTLTIEVTGRHHPMSGGGWIWIDAFETPP